MGELTGKLSESAVGKGDSTDLLLKLEREDFVEVFRQGFCQECEHLLLNRIHTLINGKKSEKSESHSAEFWSADSSSLRSSENSSESANIMCHDHHEINSPESVYSTRRKGYSSDCASYSKQSLGPQLLPNEGSLVNDKVLSHEQERIRFSQVGRKKDFTYIERIQGKQTNVLQGLELHTQVFNAEEQKKIVECVYNLQHMGQKGQLRERTYSEPRKWMRGKGRVTIQFGCCYNYAVDKKGNPPGILRDEEVDPLPPLFKQMIKRMVRWHVLPPTCVPNSCIVNIYAEGDCIPPHIDHHDFLRPFCTVSFLTESKILFGSNLKIVDAGEFSGPVSISLPPGSVLILSGNGADIAKHSVPAVPGKRISITFRKMDESKIPYKFLPDPELTELKPLVFSSMTKSPVQQNAHLQSSHKSKELSRDASVNGKETSSNNLFFMVKDEFPPLGGSSSVNHHRVNKNGLKQ